MRSCFLVGCDSGPEPSPEAKTLQACFAKRGLTVEKYLVFGTAEISYTLCSDKLERKREVDGRRMRLSAVIADFTIDEVSGSDCQKARRAIIDPIRNRASEAYKTDGPDAFCGWVGRMLDEENPELWTRFWK